jgi:long-chain fatty acid transport protein
MGRGGTGVAAPCGDGSTIFFNPAGLAFSSGQAVSVGATFIAAAGSFTNDITGDKTNLEKKVIPVPSGYYQRPLNDRWSVGLGVFVPYGLETNWPENFEGRFLGYRSMIRAVYVQPTAAVKLTDWLAVGGGVDLTFLHVQLRQHADLSTVAAAPGVTFGNLGIPSGTDFADANLHGNATNMGANLGIQLKVNSRLSLGARYLTRQRVEINKASVDFTQINTGILLPQGNPLGLPAGTPLDAVLAPQFLPDSQLSNQTGNTVLTLPEQLVVGAAYDVTPKLKLLFDYQWVNWQVFDALVLNFQHAGQKIIVENYNATSGFRFGGEYAYSPDTHFRLGVLTHEAAAPSQTVTPNLPEGPRTEFTAGFGTRLMSRLKVDLAYQYIDQADRRGRTTDGGLIGPPSTINNGLYTFHAHLFGATLTYAF